MIVLRERAEAYLIFYRKRLSLNDSPISERYTLYWGLAGESPSNKCIITDLNR